MTYYISGPMTGQANDNWPAFERAADFLRDLGKIALLPAVGDYPYKKLLFADIARIVHKADSLYMLNGWENSPGARAEHAVAVALKLPIRYEAS